MKLPLILLAGCLLAAAATARSRDAAARPSDSRPRAAAVQPQTAGAQSPAAATRPADSRPRDAAARPSGSQSPAAALQATGNGRRERHPAKAPASDRDASGPLMRFEDPVYDFGDVERKGGDVAHDFVFRNEGARPLVVLRVVTSCSCVKASFPKRPVAPGETGVIRITYEPHKSEPGAFNKVIRIYSNSSAGSDIVTVQGNSLEAPPKERNRNDKTKNK